MNLHNPASPSDILSEYLGSTSVTEAARKLNVTRVNLSKIINGHTGISPEMALRLAKAFNTPPLYWLNINSQYELWRLRDTENEILKNIEYMGAK